jgi:hypothetical protein
MKYRKFGSQDIEVSALGFGAMRLPVIGDDQGNIDFDEACKMIRYAIDHGVNYVDTAYVYHNEQSESFLGKCLQDGYREKVYIATKCPTWKADKPEDLDDLLAEELERLQTDHVDMYLLHAMSETRWEHAQEVKALEFLNRAKEDGRIRYAGFSFHDHLSVFKEIVDAYDWDFCQIQYNYMDTEYQAGREGLEYAADRGLAVVIMEPLRGGRLVDNVPEDIQEVWDESDYDRTPAEWGFRWIADHPEPSVILSGMSTMDQVVENVETFKDAMPNAFSEDELKTVEQVRDLYRERIKVNCTACNYCVPCPNDIPIPRLFGMYNDAHMYVPLDEMAERYKKNIAEEGKDISACADCGDCEEACPQGIPIREKLEELHTVFMEAAEATG